MKIAIITGSGFYSMEGLELITETFIETPMGDVELTKSKYKEHEIFFIARHGKNHERLPNMIPYREIIKSLKMLDVKLIIGTSVMGVLDDKLSLGNLFLFDDLFFIDNRMPDGSICSMYTSPGVQERGHYLFGSPYSSKVTAIAERVANAEGIKFEKSLVHAHANGPRFNTRAEIRCFKLVGCHTVSQTVGPEIILAGEAEIPYLLLGFGVDYANGVKSLPTPIEILNVNMAASKDIFIKVITGVLDKLCIDEGSLYNGFVYRFEE